MTRCQECHKKIRSNTDTEVGPDGEVLCRKCYWHAMNEYWRRYEEEHDASLDPDTE